jgi:hypothetical protein
MPSYQPQMIRVPNEVAQFVSTLSVADISPQDCPFPKKLACAAAVAGCITTPNPVACILAVAPNCLDCL